MGEPSRPSGKGLRAGGRKPPADYRKKIALVVGNIDGSHVELRRALVAVESVRGGKMPPPIVMLRKGKPGKT